MRPAVFPAALALFLGGCSLVPDSERPALAMPAAFGDAAPAPAATPLADATWWRRFGSPELSALMSDAMTGNQDLEAAFRRVAQARASLAGTRAGWFPTLSASSNANRSLHNTARTAAATEKTTYDVGGDLSWEVDLFGKTRASVLSAEATAQSQALARDALALSIQGEVATAYVTALAAKDRLAIARENLATAREILALIETQVSIGSQAPLEQAQQRSTVAGIEASLPQLEADLAAAQTSLAVLLGRAPQGFRIQAPGLNALALPAIAPGQPSDLLERRPDIREAEATLIAANADIGAARSAFFPTLTLSASASLSGALSGGTTTAGSLAGNLLGTIFDAGKREADLEVARQRWAELAATYRTTVLTALKEAEDALVTEDTGARREVALAEAVVQSTEALRIARTQYQVGDGDFLAVLTAQQTVLSSRDSLAQARGDRFQSAIDLVKALGSGWREPTASP
ncbi:RND efflux system, outer membrane lipoprotein, NodT [Rhodospirillum rubrum F11]|uniref:RND efflux system, outer membrane lipoprotein, NodT n=1 Tax=Rhodospirillum rubrum (strain ATCC 11170 / ATH 1.1.1 / DSM 467 / LMG 4362 / NCIMB 8255 / S1) TaxID=269796 RepID=Q2RPB3_RHORT|nr:efflux transporter outer membrane subunit [Rhodospirillum rubrum]ABC24032.1 RND efflux system, outer membrane lipoprotein, NodT [Rhodospirillum rubrum ATCC 11170]AEO49776.1 RND efflux system, outer membrane lipoprotein, NodT [Rhodospirillum rubrum F11]MBK5955716.1 RND transporter [Rhodospirillum rubrum]QXG79975.1 efflux transporter outer membrane subunit [Rhodospirillum rubrum]HCF18356.1 RND transporter [Rhodospirillum rubrum]